MKRWMDKETRRRVFDGGWSNDAPVKKKPLEEDEPTLFPPPLVELEAISPTNEEMVELITKHRDLKERFKNLPTFLSVAEEELHVKRYSDRFKSSSTLGCTSLPEAIRKPLPFHYFPEELHSVLVPLEQTNGSDDLYSRGPSVAQRFKRKVNIDFNRLEAIEKREKDKKDDYEVERKMSIGSDHSFDEDGDYGINHYDTADEAIEDEAEEATF